MATDFYSVLKSGRSKGGVQRGGFGGPAGLKNYHHKKKTRKALRVLRWPTIPPRPLPSPKSGAAVVRRGHLGQPSPLGQLTLAWARPAWHAKAI